MAGVFPKDDVENAALEWGPLALVQCANPGCELVQLAGNYSLADMYGVNYGYRSGLNKSMVTHLVALRMNAEALVPVGTDDVVVDIGSNDGTLLNGYGGYIHRVGFDPTIEKFGHYYDAGIVKVPDFFSRDAFYGLGLPKAKIVTSIACFYDLPDPQAFVNDVAEILADDGIWVFEQSYLVSMLRADAFDTICHEHLEFYHLKPIRRMLDRAGLRIVDVSLNDTNGGSICITAAKKGTEHPMVFSLIAVEEGYLDGCWDEVALRVDDRVDELVDVLLTRARRGDLVLGLGASTKGNVLLQRAGINRSILPAIAEVNPDKFGCQTPGTGIPIIPEAEARLMKPDAFLVLPWHFRAGFEAQYDYPGAPDLIFPLPRVATVRGRR